MKKKESHDEFVNLCMESFDLKLHPKRTLYNALYTYYWWIKVHCCSIFIMIKWNQIVIHRFENIHKQTHSYSSMRINMGIQAKEEKINKWKPNELHIKLSYGLNGQTKM